MNMSRTTKILSFSVPPTVVKEAESLAKQDAAPRVVAIDREVQPIATKVQNGGL